MLRQAFKAGSINSNNVVSCFIGRSQHLFPLSAFYVKAMTSLLTQLFISPEFAEQGSNSPSPYSQVRMPLGHAELAHITCFIYEQKG